jgi:hypothetical protein
MFTSGIKVQKSLEQRKHRSASKSGQLALSYVCLCLLWRAWALEGDTLKHCVKSRLVKQVE